LIFKAARVGSPPFGAKPLGTQPHKLKKRKIVLINENKIHELVLKRGNEFGLERKRRSKCRGIHAQGH
jgi:hypothetical protein